MKYSCSVIQDLLPLYHDGVCSEESIDIIENHLSVCDACKQYYWELCQCDSMEIVQETADWEMKKAVSYQNIRKKLLRKQVSVVFIAFIVIIAIMLSAATLLKNYKYVITYEDNISVSMVDDCLVGRLQGNRADYFKVKRVDINTDGQEKAYLFFYLSGSKWNDVITNNDVFSEYVLCSEDKGAAQIDGVFYYTGDYTNIENLNETELNKVIQQSVLLWDK